MARINGNHNGHSLSSKVGKANGHSVRLNPDKANGCVRLGLDEPANALTTAVFSTAVADRLKGLADTPAPESGSGWVDVDGVNVWNEPMHKRLPHNRVAALARPGMVILDGADYAVIEAVTKDFAVARYEDGHANALRWFELNLDDVLPDPAYLGVAPGADPSPDECGLSKPAAYIMDVARRLASVVDDLLSLESSSHGGESREYRAMIDILQPVYMNLFAKVAEQHLCPDEEFDL